MTLHTIQFGDEGQVATRELLNRFESLRAEFAQGGTPAMTRLREELRMLDTLDRQHGGEGKLPLEDVESLVAATIVDLTHLESDSRREGHETLTAPLARLVVGVALWAMRHEVGLMDPAIEQVTNALALLSNEAASAQELSAIVGLMHGVIGHVRPRLSGDLERSNPMRPWRLLHANLAVTAIRTEDPALMALAFDALDEALPEERAGFYAEALAVALGPRIAPAVRQAIEARHAKWSQPA